MLGIQNIFKTSTMLGIYLEYFKTVRNSEHCEFSLKGVGSPSLPRPIHPGSPVQGSDVTVTVTPAL